MPDEQPEPLQPSPLEILQRAFLACDRDTRKKFLIDIKLGAPALWARVENEVGHIKARR